MPFPNSVINILCPLFAIQSVWFAKQDLMLTWTDGIFKSIFRLIFTCAVELFSSMRPCVTERGMERQFSMQRVHRQRPHGVTSSDFWKWNEKLICPGSKKCLGVGDLSISILLVVPLSLSQPSSPTQLRVSAGTQTAWLLVQGLFPSTQLN